MTDTSNTLIIVESAKKCGTIKKLLGNNKDVNYILMASAGHIFNLPHDNLGIDVDNNFEPTYVIIDDKEDIVKRIKNTYNTCDDLLIASDPDREGEQIANSISILLKVKNAKRIAFHEITKSAIMKAIKNPGKINYDLVNAQQARRILDRLIGYKLSPLISNVKESKLSVGRVQSAVLRLVVDKELEINKIMSDMTTFYKISAEFNMFKKTNMYSGKNIAKISINDNSDKPEEVMLIIDACKNAEFIISDVKRSQTKRNPPAPYITSTLQQDAYNMLGFPIEKTMTLAQSLYENGMITYMRTDSPDLSEEAINMINTFIVSTFGEEYYQFRTFKKSEFSQEAHEAIRPTDINKIIESDTEENTLYNLIWKKTIASLMSSAVYNECDIVIKSKDKDDLLNVNELYFLSKNKILIFQGYLKLFNNTEDEETEKDVLKKDVNVNDEVILKGLEANQDNESIPTRYNEANLVKKMEDLGIGRPSTYASIFQKIKEKKYIQDSNIGGISVKFKNIKAKLNKNFEPDITIVNKTIGKDLKKISPATSGFTIVEFLNKHFNIIIDYKFTSIIENDLDDIANGKIEWFNVVKKFYDIIEPTIKEFRSKFSMAENKKLLGDDVYVCHGKFGFYVTNGNINCSIKDENISLEEAKILIEKKKDTKSYSHKGKTYKILNGPHGYYINVSFNNKYANVGIDKNLDPKDLTLKEILAIVDKKVNNEETKTNKSEDKSITSKSINTSMNKIINKTKKSTKKTTKKTTKK